MRGISIRNKFLYVFTGLVLLVSIAVIVLIKTVIFNKLENELQKRAVFIAKSIAAESINPILTENIFVLQSLTIDRKNVEEDIEYVFILDKKKNILAHTFGEAFPVDLVELNPVSPGKAYNIQPIITEKGAILDIAVPILKGEIGVLHVGISEEPIRKSVTGMINLSIGIMIIVLLLGGGITIFFTTTITKPILELTKVTEAVGSGDFEGKVHIKTKDEIGQLAASFNKMSENLKKSKDELDKVNEELRLEIDERKKTVNMLKEVELQQKAILDNIPDIAWLKDKESRFITVNEEFEKVCGIKQKDLSGKTDLDIWPREFAEKYLADDKEVMKTGSRKRVEELLVDKEGKTLWIETIKTPIYNDKGEVIGTTGISHNISDRKSAEKALRESETKFRVLVETAASAVFIYKGTKFKFVNRTAETLTGFSKKEILAMDFWDIAHPDFKNIVMERGLGRQRGDRVPDRYEIKILTKNGEEKWIDLTAGLVEFEGELAGLGTAFDITESKRAEEALRESESKFRKISQEFEALLDTIPDNLILLSNDLMVIWANRGAAAGLGKEIHELVGQYCYQLWYNRSTPCPYKKCPVQICFQTGRPETAQTTTPDGKIWDIRTFPLKDETGRVINVIEAGRDITEHQKLEALLLQAQKMEAVGQLAGGVAHDFNNILTAIMGYGNLLQMKMKKDDPLRHNVDQILASSERAAHLTQSLLAFSRKQVIDLKPSRLNEIINIVEKLLLKLIGEDIELQTVLTDKDLIVMADSGQIEQVLMNLATNARDAMPDGGILHISTELVELDEEHIKTHGYGKPGKYALISVTDTGVGMDEKTREKLFEPFFTTKEVGKGTGLGLSIAYGIVKQHNGYINVNTELGKGTTFKIFLPLVKSEVDETTHTTVTAPITGSEIILVAEDESEVRKITKSVLKEFGYKVIEAVDGADAIHKFMENEDKIQFLLFDLIMPNKNGRDAYEEIRKVRPDIKVLFMSGYSADIVQKKGIIEEGLDFVLKPISPTELLVKMREVLDK